DANLSIADASFWGENQFDKSGRSATSAGDVNGDGNDDILIGAGSNDDGGDNAGQTYLIFPFPNDSDDEEKEDGLPSIGLVGTSMTILLAALVASNRRRHSWGKRG
ncbi:MAG: FG-GAP repeat protein, partial [Thermoplasmata archaeon]|nr:FG-GAP repeat protein [Thermoplasmata archaeon]